MTRHRLTYQVIRQCSLSLVIPFLLAALVPAAYAAAADSWQAGAAKVVITPPEQMWMAGYGSRDRPSEGKLTELFAKALVLQDAAGNRGTLITLDLVGIDRRMYLTITTRLKERFGFEHPEVMICTSHTHAGPVVGMNLAPLHYLTVDPEQQRKIDAYASRLPDTVADVVAEALARLEPSTVAWGNGRATFAVNRRNNPANDVPRLRTEDRLAGPVDHDVPVLAVHNNQGQLTAVVFGYACHATVLSFYQWSGDYPGFAQQELEALHPETVALFFAGCGADQNPLPRRTVELARHYGRRLADAVDAVLLTSQLETVEPAFARSYQEVPLPLDTLPSRDDLQRDVDSSNKYTAARAKQLLQQLDADGKLDDAYPYPIGLWKLGDQVTWVFLGGEVVVDYALRLKAELSGPRTWVAGYANDVMAYIPSRRVLNEGGYEGGGAMVYYGLPTIWSPEVERVLVDAVHGLITTP